MARTVKKKKELTLEEKLAEALVPVEEQPYQVPENWCWTKLSSCIITSKEKTADFSDSKIKYIGLEHMEKDSGIIGYGSAEGVKSLKNVFHKGQLLYGKLRPYLNKHDIAPFDGICSTDILVFDKTECSLTSFVNYYFNQSRFLEYVVGNSKGINLPRVSESVILEAMVPLPPLPEQQRIVDRIESLFAKLDEAKEKAQAVVDGFEDRKAAILHKAFTGELIGLSSGNTVPLETIVDTIRIGPFGSALHKEDYIVGGTPVINPKHIVNQQIVPDQKITISKDKVEELRSYKLKTGDIIMGRRGEMGRSAPVTDKENGWLCGTGSLIIRLQEGYNALFYSQIIASQASVQFLEDNCVGSTMKNLNEKVVKNLPVPQYSKKEQQEIVTVLIRLFEKEQQAKEAAEQVISQIDTMKKSILARAFRGELGTNDPADESAVELLKRIL